VRPLRALIAAEVISSLGSLMSVVALPWFVLETTGSPGRMSVVLAAEAAPLALVGIPSSRLVARLGARRSLLVCDAVWAPATALIPILHYAGGLTFGVLLVLAFLAGMPWAAHYGSQSAVAAELLGEDVGRIAQVTALLQTLSRLAYFAGPALGGLLLAAFGAPTVLLVDAASFVVSFALVAAFVRARPVRAAERTAAPVAGGWRFIRGDSWLRSVTAAQMLSQAAFMAMIAAIPVLVFTAYDRDAGLAGLLLGAWGGGAMLGSLAAFRLVASRDPLRLGAAAWVLQALPLWILVASPPAAVAVAALVVSGVGNGLRVPPVTGLTTRRVPHEIRAQTMTVVSSLVLSGGFVALLAAGPALDNLDVGVVWAAIAALQTVAALTFVRVAARSRAATLAPDSS
jgi:MFS family permease